MSFTTDISLILNTPLFNPINLSIAIGIIVLIKIVNDLGKPGKEALSNKLRLQAKTYEVKKTEAEIALMDKERERDNKKELTRKADETKGDVEKTIDEELDIQDD